MTFIELVFYLIISGNDLIYFKNQSFWLILYNNTNLKKLGNSVLGLKTKLYWMFYRYISL